MAEAEAIRRYALEATVEPESIERARARAVTPITYTARKPEPPTKLVAANTASPIDTHSSARMPPPPTPPPACCSAKRGNVVLSSAASAAARGPNQRQRV